jgi:CcmD family protein
MNDATSFFLAFTAIFALLAASLVRLELRARRIEERLETLEAARKPKGGA